MRRNTIGFLFALFPLVPGTSQFAYALILAAALLFCYASGILYREILTKLDLSASIVYLELAFLAGTAVLFQLLAGSIFPILSHTLSLDIYLVSFTYILLLGIDRFHLDTSVNNKGAKAFPVLLFIPFMLAFSLLRELAGFGTLSLPTSSGLHTILVLPAFKIWGIPFWGTTGGSLILLGFCTWIAKYASRRFTTLYRNKA